MYLLFNCHSCTESEAEANEAVSLSNAGDAAGLWRLIGNSGGRLYLTGDAKYLQATGCKGKVIMNLALRADLTKAVLTP